MLLRVELRPRSTVTSRTPKGKTTPAIVLYQADTDEGQVVTSSAQLHSSEYYKDPKNIETLMPLM